MYIDIYRDVTVLVHRFQWFLIYIYIYVCVSLNETIGIQELKEHGFWKFKVGSFLDWCTLTWFQRVWSFKQVSSKFEQLKMEQSHTGWQWIKRHVFSAWWFFAYPSEKYESVGMMTFPIWWEKIKLMFQTTNQFSDFGTANVFFGLGPASNGIWLYPGSACLSTIGDP